MGVPIVLAVGASKLGQAGLKRCAIFDGLIGESRLLKFYIHVHI